jgi:hypothetical protein
MKVGVYSRYFYESEFWWASSLFLDRTYPANAEAVEDSELLCISKNNFWN